MSQIFGQRLRAARESKKWSQSDLADRAGLQVSAISHFETGRRAPSFDNLKRLADALSVTVDYLLGRVNEPTVAGPLVDKVFRNLKSMSENDQQMVADFAEMLKRKSEKPTGDGKK